VQGDAVAQEQDPPGLEVANAAARTPDAAGSAAQVRWPVRMPEAPQRAMPRATVKIVMLGL